MTVDRELWIYIPSLRSSCTTRLLCSTPERQDTKKDINEPYVLCESSRARLCFKNRVGTGYPYVSNS